MFVCMGVCVCERDRERERERERACLSKTHTKECLQNFEKLKQTKTRKKTCHVLLRFLLTVFALNCFLVKVVQIQLKAKRLDYNEELPLSC